MSVCLSASLSLLRLGVGSARLKKGRSRPRLPRVRKPQERTGYKAGGRSGRYLAEVGFGSHVSLQIWTDHAHLSIRTLIDGPVSHAKLRKMSAEDYE